jgi:hypothetical protein
MNFVYNKPMNQPGRHIFYRVAALLTLVFILISCEPFIPALEAIPQQTSGVVQATPYPPLPLFIPRALNPLDTPHTYVENSCMYLINRWNRLNAAPGTVVMIIEFNEDVLYDFGRIMGQLRRQGFKAINTQQLLVFMERNGKIPMRSVLLIQDNNHSAGEMKRFEEYWKLWKWPVVNGWVSDPDIPETLWQENVEMEYEGWVDHQAQGVTPGTVLSNDSSKTVISRELKGSITNFAARYSKNPIAYIWAGNGFGQRPVEAARILGYQLGFTSNPRGPVMYNWVPLADEFDPQRATYLPEGYIGDPLMTLPRYSQDQVLKVIDVVRVISNQAAEFARQNKAAEFEYYDTVCKPVYGKMPTP